MKKSDDTRPLMVSIWCLTYNHESYISQCLDGFVMQNTNFRFEAIVHEDASTDGTAAIVRKYAEKYPEIIKPIFETENQYSKNDGSIDKIMMNYTQGKYVAICEGDDYWIDENKLQRQVDYLESHPDCGLVYQQCKCYLQRDKKFTRTSDGKNVIFEELMRINTISTLTTMFRHSLQRSYYEEIHPEDQGWLLGDYPLWLYIAKQSKIQFMPGIVAVYRMLGESASHSGDFQKYKIFVESCTSMKVFFCEKYGYKAKEFGLYDGLNISIAKDAMRHAMREETLSYLNRVEHLDKSLKILKFACSNSLLFFIFRKVYGVLRNSVLSNKIS